MGGVCVCVCVCEDGMGVSSESYGGVRVSDHL